VDRELAANTGSLGGTGTISYQWQISGSADGTYANITGATNSTYTPGSGDVGKYLKVTVTRAGYSGSETSPATAAVVSADTPDPTVTGVNITGPSSVAKGETETYTAEVTGTNSPPETVTWSIVESDKKDATTISSTGVLSVAGDETLTSITVKAASTFDPDRYDTKTVAITGGVSSAKIDVEDFGPSAVIAATFDIAGRDDWDAALAAIQEGGNNKNYVINLTDDVTIPGISTGYSFGSVTGIIVSLRGNKSLVLSPYYYSWDDSNESLLRIGDKQTLILRESSLVGKSGNSGSLVDVYYGSFTMRSGKISGNSITITNSSAAMYFYGGGVSVYGYGYGGSFTMSGGEISGNSLTTSSSAFSSHGGGGVYVGGNSTFTMSGGEISGNSAAGGGSGGVYVNSGGLFTKTGGTIYGDTNRTHNPGDIENTATGIDTPGHAVRYSTDYDSVYYFCNETLGAGDSISTEDNMPLLSGQTLGKWTKR
jgi:hypothetical protein